MKSPRISYGWVVLATGFVIMLLGYAIRNTFTVFYPVIVNDFGWARGNTAIMYTLTMLCYGLVAPLAGSLVDRLNPKIVIASGGLIVSGGIALCGQATAMWHFYLLYGVMVAVGLSLMGFTPLSAIITHWFSHRKGLVFGLLGAGFGVSLVSAPVFQHLISSYGWRNSYVIIGLTAAAIIVPLSIALIKRSPGQHEADEPPSPSCPYSAGVPETIDVPPGPEWTVRSAFSTRTFKILLFISFCNMGFAQQILITHQVYFLQDLGYEPMVAASIFSVFGACFAVGNISSGLSDHLGRSKVFTPASFVAASAIFLLFMAESLGGLFLPLTFAVLGGIGLGITPPTCFAAVADYFHGRNYGSIQGTVILACAIGGALGPWLGGFLHDLSGSYIVTLVIVQVLVVVSGLLMWFVDPGRNRRVAH